VTHRARERLKLHGVIREQVRDLARSTLHSGADAALRPAMDTLLQLERREYDGLVEAVERLLATAVVVPLTQGVFNQAMSYRARFGLSVQDSIVFASVMLDADQRNLPEQRCFISRNFKDFGACLERSCAHALQHQMGHRDQDHDFTGLG
jgi:hypothetical protein